MLSKFSVKKPYTVLVAVVLVIVLGVVSFTRMTTDLLPNISLPYVIVMTTYPGASPETVETVVTKPVESSMATVSNIESISSVSSENYSMVILEFSQSTDMNAVSLEIRENLDQIKSYWSDSVGNPIIMKLNPDMLPVMIAAVGGNEMDASQITAMTENMIIPELESIEGVASASATGLLEESVNVVIRQEKIDEINKQVFGSIDVEIDEAKEELDESRQEVYDGQAEINDARKELEGSKQDLRDGQQELEDGRLEIEENRKELEDGEKKIEDGRGEIAENKTKLEEGKTELANKKGEAAKQLAEAETQLLTAKADAEAAKIHLTLEIAQMRMMLEEAEKQLGNIGSNLPGGPSKEELNRDIAKADRLLGALEGLNDSDSYAKVDESTREEINGFTGIDFSSGDDDGNGDGNSGNNGSEDNDGNGGNTGDGDSENTGGGENNGNGGNTGSNDDGNSGNTGSGDDGNSGNTGSGDDGSGGNTGSSDDGNSGDTGSSDDGSGGNTGSSDDGNSGDTGSGDNGNSGNTGNSDSENHPDNGSNGDSGSDGGSQQEKEDTAIDSGVPGDDNSAGSGGNAGGADKESNGSPDGSAMDKETESAGPKEPGQDAGPGEEYITEEVRIEAHSNIRDSGINARSAATVGQVRVALESKKAILQAQADLLDKGNESVSSIKNMIETYKQSISEMEGKVSDLENNITLLDSALSELYQGNLIAAIELANAQTTISLGEMQITAAETQLDASEKQLEAGKDQLDAALKQLEEGQEQINAGWDQLRDGEEQLNDTAKQLADALEQILEGEEKLEESREEAYGKADMNGVLTVETVEKLLQAQNFSMPAGYVMEEGISYLIRVGDKPETIEEMKKMPLLNLEMEGVDIITLGDVADVFMADNQADIYANVNGAPGIMVTIQKQTGYSTGDVSDKILAKFDQLREENEGLMLITLMDQGIYIDLVMDSIINNILFGGVLAVLILILFLKDLRPTAVIACSIPISLITAIVCMYFSGITLNVISLSGLALGIGMLVDNSIVVIENIYRMRKEGRSALEAAIEGAGEVAAAIMASTLTPVCVFLPIVFTEGITRQLFVDMGLTIAYSLLASLVIALTVVPAMASQVLVKTRETSEGKFFTWLAGIYDKLLGVALRFKPVVFVLVVALLAASAAASYAKGTAFMPDMDSTQFTITLTLPKDTPLGKTGEITDEVVERLMAREDVADVGAMASSSSMSMLSGGGNTATNATTIYVTLKEDKEKGNDVIADEIMEQASDICEENQAEMEIDTSSMDMSALGGSGITIQVRGRDIDTLQKIAAEVAGIVEGVEGTENVSDGLGDSTGELRVLIDRDKAIQHGMTVAEVFQQMAAKLAESSSATTLESVEMEYSVYVKHAGDMELTRELVKGLVLDRTKQDGTKEKVPLADIATFQDTISPKGVNRIEQNRYIAVTAEIAEGYNVGLVSGVLEGELAKYDPPAGYTLVMSGENETITEAMGQLYLMLLLALIFMYLIMVAQFQSLLSPFIIMFTIPLAFTGGFLGLVASDSELSVVALIGFVMLSGIIVNNGIVLVDYMNQLRSEGMEKREAILEAGRTRLRPVLMTALTTILALCTMVFSHDMGSEMGRPMAVVTIGGLTYGTLLTLVVIPCIYDIFSREKKPGDGALAKASQGGWKKWFQKKNQAEWEED